MSAYKNIALVGASGNIGKIILDGLLTTGTFNVTVLSRHESTATFPAGVTVRKTDFSSDAALTSALSGQDAVISALGATGFGEQKKLVDAAVAAGAQRFLPSEFSASSQDDAVLGLLPLFGQKKELIEYLKSKEGQISWTGVATGLLFDWGLANGFLEYNIQARTATIWDDGNKPLTLTNAAQLGLAVSSVLQRPAQTANKYLYVASIETTQNAILSALEATTGDKWTVTRTTTEEQVGEAFKKLGAGDFSGAFALVRATGYGSTPGLRANYTKDEVLANSILGLEWESVEETVKKVAAQ